MVIATVASYMPFPAVSLLGEAGLRAMGETTDSEAAMAVAMTLVPGGKIAMVLGRATGSMWSAALHMARNSAAGRVIARQADGLMQKARALIRRGCGCLEAGTLVWTAQGLEPIENVRAGDLVFAQDEATGLIELRRVNDVFIREFAPIIEVIIHTPFGTDAFRTTEEHPWLNPRGEWIPSGELQPGDELITSTETRARVLAVRFTSERRTVYNLHIEGVQTYLVGVDGVVVHNNTPPTLPDKILIEEDGFKLYHNFGAEEAARGAPKEHGPAHLHLEGRNGEVRIGQNGHPLDGDRALNRREREFVEKHRGLIRRSIDKIMRWHRACRIKNDR